MIVWFYGALKTVPYGVLPFIKHAVLTILIYYKKLKRVSMIAKMNSNFINYSDFLNILIEAFTIAPKELFEKMI